MTEEKTEEKDGMPVKQEIFLEAGVHIGTKIRTNDMRQYIFKRRDDGLYILDLRKSAERIMEAAKLISEYKPEEVTVVASRVYSSNPATRFSALTGVNVIKGRYVPGTMTNIQYKKFIEPKLMIVCDPKGERQALAESRKTGVRIIGLCDSDNETNNIDHVIPVNNKGKRSLALVFYILTRELMMSQGTIKSYDEFKYDVSYFEQMVMPEPEKPEEGVQEEAPEKEEEKAEKEAPKEKAKEEKPKKEEKAEAKEAPKKEEKKAEEPKAEKPKEAPKKEEKPKEAVKEEAKEEKPAAEKKAEPKEEKKK
jgi:small subunit ribosomal protein S2